MVRSYRVSGFKFVEVYTKYILRARVCQRSQVQILAIMYGIPELVKIIARRRVRAKAAEASWLRSIRVFAVPMQYFRVFAR